MSDLKLRRKCCVCMFWKQICRSPLTLVILLNLFEAVMSPYKRFYVDMLIREKNPFILFYTLSGKRYGKGNHIVLCESAEEMLTISAFLLKQRMRIYIEILHKNKCLQISGELPRVSCLWK